MRLAAKDTVLIRDGDWELRRVAPVPHILNLHSYIAHKCSIGASDAYFWWSLNLVEEACFGCSERPPPNLMGVWKLHNFDYIQNGGLE
jgi:hypothetical protein